MVNWLQSCVLALFSFAAAFLKDRVDKIFGFLQLLPDGLASGVDVVKNKRAEESRPKTKFLGGDDGILGVVDCHLEPLLVTAKLLAEEDTGRHLGDNFESSNLDRNLGPIYDDMLVPPNPELVAKWPTYPCCFRYASRAHGSPLQKAACSELKCPGSS
jgi:hypothetical protein